MSMENEQQTAVRQDVILDSNAIHYGLDKKVASSFTPIILDLINKNFVPAVSQISVYETLKKTNPKRETEILNFLKSNFKNYEIDDTVLLASARLFTFYGNEDNIRNSISSEDIIIAATSILTGSLLLTADCNDFPRPFFDEVYKQPIFYSDRKCVVIYLFRPDYDFLNEKIEKYFSSNN